MEDYYCITQNNRFNENGNVSIICIFVALFSTLGVIKVTMYDVMSTAFVLNLIVVCIALC